MHLLIKESSIICKTQKQNKTNKQDKKFVLFLKVFNHFSVYTDLCLLKLIVLVWLNAKLLHFYKSILFYKPDTEQCITVNLAIVQEVPLE